jgi:hypothetical protein
MPAELEPIADQGLSVPLIELWLEPGARSISVLTRSVSGRASSISYDAGILFESGDRQVLVLGWLSTLDGLEITTDPQEIASALEEGGGVWRVRLTA